MAKRKRRSKRPARKGARTRSPRAIEAALAGLAHDIRTPLTGMVALADLLAASDLPERQRDWARSIKSGAEHLSALSSLIVDAVRADAAGLVLQREPFSPRALAQAVAEAFSARAEGKGLASDISIAPDLPERVAGDAVRLRAALENLADNAVKFTHSGKVSFAALAAEAGRGRVRLVFTISDTGTGLTAAELKNLFKPFAQASVQVAQKYGGAGLGLAFVKRIAKAMGGDVRVKSKKGEGSTFELSVVVDTVEPNATSKQAKSPRARRSLKLLCVEDNPYGRVVMNTILGELGHKVDFVETGEAAVEAVGKRNYDAVLMDIALPGIDGCEATRRIRALPGAASRVPIVGLSARSEANAEADARAAGMNAYLMKPVSPRNLSNTLCGLLEEMRP
jgi:CheY-like chemotaxis protein/nitrogen-specific signal transduction histidine kinase